MVPSRWRLDMPRASWKGFLRLSLVSCPIYLAPATTRTKSARLHQVWRPTSAEKADEAPSRAERRDLPDRLAAPRFTPGDAQEEEDQTAQQLGSVFALTIPAPARRSSANRSSKATNIGAANSSRSRRKS